MNFCLIPEKVNEFKKKLKDKEITIPELLKMTTEERVKLLEEYSGESAKEINALFESKLVLKNRMLGLRNWAMKLAEVGKYSPEGKAKLEKEISDYRAAQQERIFNPKENETFLAGMAEKQLGTSISREEASNIFKLSKKADEARSLMVDGKWKKPEDRAAYGALRAQYESYVSQLKGEGEPFMEVVKGRIDEFKKTAEKNKFKAVADVGLDSLTQLQNNTVELVATGDNSFIGRQGWNTLLTHPSTWYPAAKQSFIDIYNTMGGQNTMNALMSDYYSRENFLNGEYRKAGIDGKLEEETPTVHPQNIPYVGRVIKAADMGFRGSALRMRMDLYDLLRRADENLGIDMKDEAYIRDAGSIVGSLTARGRTGKMMGSPLTKAILWAPRMLKANWDVLTAHNAGMGLETNRYRKEAATNIAKIVGVMYVLNLMAYSMSKDSTESNPLSSNFGQITVNDTKMSRILSVVADIFGISANTRDGRTKFGVDTGILSLLTLISRQVLGKSKSASTGAITEYGSGFGETNRTDALIEFLFGKTTPLVNTLIQYGKGKTYEGHKPTLQNTIEGLTVPISIQNILGFNDVVGGTDWNMNTGAELSAFRDKIGQSEFDKANKRFNQLYFDWLKERKDEPNNAWNNLPSDEKKDKIASAKEALKKKIFTEYGFKPEKAKKTK